MGGRWLWLKSKTPEPVRAGGWRVGGWKGLFLRHLDRFLNLLVTVPAPRLSSLHLADKLLAGGKEGWKGIATPDYFVHVNSFDVLCDISQLPALPAFLGDEEIPSLTFAAFGHNAQLGKLNV